MSDSFATPCLPEAICPVRSRPPVPCLCHGLPSLDVAVRFVVIRHRNEISRVSSTGWIVPRLLRGSVVVDHGLKDVPLDLSVLEDPGIVPYVLFPQLDASVIAPSHLEVEPGRELVLIVPDASWRKARRMLRRIEALRGLPSLKLPPGDVRHQTPRRAPSRQHHFTLEAVARAVGALGLRQEAAVLARVTDQLVDRIRGLTGRHCAPEKRISTRADLE